MRLFQRIGAAVAADWIDRRQHQRGRSRLVPSCAVFRLGPLLRSGVLAALGGLFLTAAAPGQETPTVTVTADAESIEEGETASFTLSRTAPLDAALTVNLEVSASHLTAFPNVLGAKTATFGPGEATAAYEVNTFDNPNFQEVAGSSTPSQFVGLDVKTSSDSSYTVGDANSALVGVTDNEEVVEFSLVVPDGGVRVPEGGGSVPLSISAITLTAGAPSDNLYEINVLTDTNRSAGSGVDFRPLSETIGFSGSGWSTIDVAGETRYTQNRNVSLEVFDDAIAEGDETFILYLEKLIGLQTPPYGVQTTLVTILDDDTAGVMVSPTSLLVAEGSTNTYSVVLTSQPPGYDEVFVTMSPPAGTDVSVDPTRLTFDLDNWDSAQTVTVTAADDDDAVVDSMATIAHSVSGDGYTSVSVVSVEVAITENDAASVLVSPTSLTVTENSTGAYTVKLASAPTADVEVTVSVPANMGVSANPTSLTFTSQTWNTAQTVTVTAADDADATTNPEVTISHSVSGGDYGALSVDSVTVDITEDDAAGVTVSPTSLSVTEGTSGVYTVELTAAPTANVVVAVSVPANMGVSAHPTSLTFTSQTWNTAQTVTVTAADDADAVVEAPVTIGHRASGGGYGSVSVDAVTVRIGETDTAGVLVSAAALTVTEGAKDTYTVKLTSAPTADVLIAVTPPTGGEVTVNPTALTFTPTTWSTAQTVTLTATEDQDATMGSAVMIAHSASGGGYDSVSVAGVRVTITENDMVGVSIAPTEIAVTEGATNTYLVRLASAPTADVEVSVSAPPNTDVSVDPTALTFTATTWSTAQTVTVAAAQDVNHATNAPVTITHSATGGDYDMVSVPSVVVRIEEDDRQASVTADQATVQEGGEARFTVSLAGGSALAPLFVTYSVTGSATSGADYPAPTGRLTIPTGASRGTITIATMADGVLDAGETLIVTLTGVSTSKGMASVTATPATTTILDSGMVTVSVGPASASEGDALAFPATLSGRVSSDVVLGWSTAAVTAVSDTDYTAVTSGALTIEAGDASGTLTVSTKEDTLAEANETFQVTIATSTAPPGVSLGVASASGTIQDDDLLTALVAAETVNVAEGSPASFTVTLTGGTSTAEVMVTYSLGGTATEGRDYEAPAGRLTIGPGAGSAPIEIATRQDDVVEPDETLIVTLAGASTAKGSARVDATPATATIADGTAPGGGDSPPDLPTVTIASGRSSVVEGSPVVFTVTRSQASSDLLAVLVRCFETGSMLADAPPVLVRFAEGETISLLRLGTVDDHVSGPGTEVHAILVAGEGYVLGTAASAVVTVTDNDAAPRLTIEGASAAEGAGMVEFVARLSQAAARPLSAVWATADGAAVAGKDYIPASGVLNFPAGTTEARFAVELIDDDVAEGEEEFAISLSEAQMTVDEAPIRGLIVDDDGLPVEVALTLDRERVSEGEGPIAVSVTASLSGGRWDRETVVEIEVAGGGEAGAVDFAPVDRFEIPIPAGASSASARFTLTPENDRVDERDETIAVSGSSVLPVLPASLVLEDDDERSRSIALAVAPEVVSEGGGSAMVEVTASLDLSSRAVDTPVRIAVSDSGEPGAVDYRAVESFELTIPRGELSGSVSLTLTPENDRVDELHETIHLSGTSALPVAPASLVLEDDDETSEAILLTVAPEVVPEDAGPTVVTVTASLDRSARNVETPVRILAIGSGLSGVVGFEPVGAFTLTIPTEEMSGSATFVLTPANDMEEAHPETVEVSGEADLPVSPARLMLIDDDDASLASAWLSRFARTVASQTVETVEERLVGMSAPADHLTLAGYRILAGRGPHRHAGAGAGPGAPAFGGGAWLGGPQPGAPLQAGPLPVGAGSAGGGGRGFSLGRYRADRRRDLLARSSFSLSSSAGEDPGVDDAGAGAWTAWGRGALTNFRGVEEDLSLRGDVVTGTVGVDYERGRYLAGLAVGFSRGEGGFGGGPEAEASLTSGHPYMRIQVGENLSLWGVLGYGRGDFVLTEENGRGKETDIALAMGAVGLRRDLVSSARGFGLGLKADVFLARIDSEPAPGLAAVGEDVNRARLALEASYDQRFAAGGVLTPSLEVGVRYDGGDADRGRGVEMGAGLRYSDRERGLRIEFSGRSLLTHEASGFEEWGGSGDVALDPGESGRGVSFGLRSSWGSSHGGIRQFWSRQQMFDGAGRPTLQQGGRVEAEAGYGFERAAGRFLVSPYGVLMVAEEGERGFGAGARFEFARSFSLSLEVSRRRFAGAESQDAVVLRGTLRRGPRVGPERPVRAGAEEARSAAPPATPSPR